MRFYSSDKTSTELKNGVKNRKEALKFILSFIKGHWRSVLVGVITLVVVDIIQLYIPRIIQRVIDELGKASFSREIIGQGTLSILLLAIAMVVLRFFWRIFIVGSARKIEKEVREEMFSHIQGLGFSFFNRKKTGSLMALMINDVNAIRMVAGPSIIALTDAVFMGSLSLFFIFSINSKLAFYTIAPLPVILFLMFRFGPMVQSRFKAVQASFAAMSAQAQECFSGIRVVKGFVQEDNEIRMFKEKCDDYVERNIRLIKIWGVFFPAITLLASLSLAVLYIVGGRSVISTEISFGQFVSFSMYLQLLVWPVIATGWVFVLIQRGLASADRILEVLNEKPDISDTSITDFSIKSIKGTIELRDLSFRYPGDKLEVLKDINLKVDAGKSLGIVGRPGSGKSTIGGIILHLFPIERGKVFIDGRGINEIPIKLIRRSIGYVSQNPFLFSDTIRNNLIFGLDREPDENEIYWILDLVNLTAEIEGFPNGLDTVIGERGITLSGGQKQRIAIARALLINPPILIFDDAFSNVDSSTERRVLNAIFREIVGDKTVLFISHKLSVVRKCDRIIVLEDGRIIQEGNHDQLIGEPGYYRTVYEFQSLEENIDDNGVINREVAG